MRFHLNGLSVALVAVTLVLGAAPASANALENQNNSLRSGLDQLATTLKSESERVLDATSQAAEHVIADGRDALVDATMWSQDFRATLNEQKAQLGIIGEDVAGRLNASMQEAKASWLATWHGSWTEMKSELRASATEALDGFRAWFEALTVPGEPFEFSV